MKKYDYSNPQEYLWSREMKNSRRKKGHPFRALLFFFLVCGLLIVSVQHLLNYTQQSKKIISPVQHTIAKSVKAVETKVFGSGLKDVVSSSLANADGEYAVYIKNLKTGEEYALHPHEKFATASLYKLWVMCATYQKINNGSLHLDDQLDKQVVDLNNEFNIASDEAELTEGEIDTSVSNALEQMITISNNYSALILTDAVGLSSLNSFLHEYGLSESSTGSPPTSTVSDIAKLYDDLYKGKIISPEYSKTMLDTLKRQQLNDRIPKYLPEDVEVAHKTGELDGNKHDAGIVYAPKGAYIIVVMSKTDDESVAAERIAKLSKAVFDYFQQESS